MSKLRKSFLYLKKIFDKIKGTGHINGQEKQSAEHSLVRLEQLRQYPKLFGIIAAGRKDKMKNQLGLFRKDGIVRCA